MHRMKPCRLADRGPRLEFTNNQWTTSPWKNATQESHTSCVDVTPGLISWVGRWGTAFSCKKNIKCSPDKEPNKTRFRSYTTSPPPPHKKWVKFDTRCVLQLDQATKTFPMFLISSQINTVQPSVCYCVLLCATVHMEDTVLQEISMVTNLISVTTFSLYFTAALALSS